MIRRSLRFLFITRGEADLEKWAEIAGGVYGALGGQCEITIASSIEAPEGFPAYIRYYNVYNGFKEFRRFYGADKTKEIGEELYSFSDMISPTAYRIDERSILNAEPASDLAAEQLFLIRKAIAVYDEAQPSHVFAAEAGDMIRTVFFTLAKYKSAYRYRVTEAGGLAQGIGQGDVQKAYFFCDNDFDDVTDDCVPLFNHDDRALEAYANDALYKLHSTRHELVSDPGSAMRSRWVSGSATGVLRDSLRIVRNYLSNNRLELRRNQSRVRHALRLAFQSGSFDREDAIKGPFILMPLNAFSDTGLRQCAREWTDIEGLIRLFASNLPFGVQLVTKAHPGNPGMLAGNVIRRLKDDFPELRILSHVGALKSVMEKCRAVIVASGEAALEAAIHQKPCIYLGTSYRGRLPNVVRLRSAADIEATLLRCLKRPLPDCSKPTRDLLKLYYHQVYPRPDMKEPWREGGDARLIAEGITQLVRASGRLAA